MEKRLKLVNRNLSEFEFLVVQMTINEMKHLLNRLINQESISSEEAKKVLVNISKGDYNQSQIASFLTVYMMRSITLEELRDFEMHF